MILADFTFVPCVSGMSMSKKKGPPEPQLLSPHATTPEARAPRAHALQQEKPQQ